MKKILVPIKIALKGIEAGTNIEVHLPQGFEIITTSLLTNYGFISSEYFDISNIFSETPEKAVLHRLNLAEILKDSQLVVVNNSAKSGQLQWYAFGNCQTDAEEVFASSIIDGTFIFDCSQEMGIPLVEITPNHKAKSYNIDIGLDKNKEYSPSEIFQKIEPFLKPYY